MYNCKMEHLKRMMLLHLVWCSVLIWSQKKGTMSKYAGNNNSNSSIFYFICFMTGCPQSSFHTMYDCRETLNSCCSSWTIFFFHHRKLAFANHRNGNMLLAGFSEFSSVGKMAFPSSQSSSICHFSSPSFLHVVFLFFFLFFYGSAQS